MQNATARLPLVEDERRPLPMEYSNRVCAFCGQRTDDPCSPREFRKCDQYDAVRNGEEIAVLLH